MSTARKRTAKPRTASDAVDEQLARYREMRDFSITAEPRGGSGPSSTGLPFVIQKHAATRLHYDFRLGWNGVLKSWAVAKGPSYVTSDKRLAVQVEDHPIEYGGFEGIIPKGQYGGGTVMVWDQGTWAPQAGHEDVEEGLRSGSLKFVMHGEKMRGKWTLVRMGGKAAARESKPNWLLIKEHDEFERSSSDPPLVEDSPNSVVTGRSLEEISGQEDHVWNSKQTAGKAQPWYRQEEKEKRENKEGKKTAPKRSVSVAIPDLEKALSKSKAPKEKLPDFIEPELAETASSSSPSSDEGWLHELKLDGYRIQARKEGRIVRLLTRKGLDWTHRMKTIAAQVAELPVESALFDGEVVVLAEDGTTSFADLQAAFQEGVRKPLSYFIFDLLHLNGHNLRGLPLLERKRLLQPILQEAEEWIRYSDHVEGQGEALFAQACKSRAEGIVSKRAQSAYLSGRGHDWQKFKCVQEQEFVIGGFTLPGNGTYGVGALLLGHYDGKRLLYAGRSGTGFTQKTHRVLRDKLETLKQKEMPFHDPPAEARKDALWVKPELVAQIRFANWTADDLLRQASFQGLREDKPAVEVHREDAAPVQKKSARHRTAPHHAAKALPEKKPSASVRLTHPDKILDEQSGLTKQQLADYYSAVAEHMLPHIEGRPLSLVRCPDGSGSPCFFQKHRTDMLPAGIDSVNVPMKKTGKTEPFITLSTREALVSLAQLGVLEVHPWGSRNEELERPDRIVIDLDPDEAISWTTLTESAQEAREALKQLGLESFLKLTGGKGLHLVVPVAATNEWPEVKDFAHRFVEAMEQQNPKLYLTKMTKAARKGRIYLDYLRNERGATAVAPFSPRARAGAAVSMPLAWSELKSKERPVFRVVDYESWKSRLGKDPWKNLSTVEQRLSLS